MVPVFAFSLSLAVPVSPRTGGGGGGGAEAWSAGRATGSLQPAPGGPSLPGLTRIQIVRGTFSALIRTFFKGGDTLLLQF